MLEALCVIAAQYLPKEDIIWAVSTVSVCVCYEYSNSFRRRSDEEMACP